MYAQPHCHPAGHGSQQHVRGIRRQPVGHGGLGNARTSTSAAHSRSDRSPKPSSTEDGRAVVGHPQGQGAVGQVKRSAGLGRPGVPGAFIWAFLAEHGDETKLLPPTQFRQVEGKSMTFSPELQEALDQHGQAGEASVCAPTGRVACSRNGCRRLQMPWASPASCNASSGWSPVRDAVACYRPPSTGAQPVVQFAGSTMNFLGQHDLLVQRPAH